MSEVFPAFLAGILATIIGGLVVNWLWQRSRSRANLRWFVLYANQIPRREGYFGEISQLIESSYEDSTIMSPDTRHSLREGLFDGGKALCLGLANSGNAPARNVTVLLNAAPSSLLIEPSVAVDKLPSANGHVELKISSVGTQSLSKLTIFGIDSFDVSGVFLDGDRIERDAEGVVFQHYLKKPYSGMTIVLAVLAAYYAGLYVTDIVNFILPNEAVVVEGEQQSQTAEDVDN